MLPGISARRSHGYARNGTTSLLAALGVANGLVIGKYWCRHRGQAARSYKTLARLRLIQSAPL